MADLVCSSSRDGIPEGCTKGNPILSTSGVYALAHGTRITHANICSLSSLLDLVIAGTLLPLHNVFAIEDMSTDKIVEESNIGRKKTNHPGFRGYKLVFNLTPDEHQALKTWEGANMDFITYDIGGTIAGRNAGTGYIGGFNIDYFDIEKNGVPTPDGGMKSIVEVQESDPAELDDFKYLKPSKFTAVADRWKPTDVKTISKATITQTSNVAANVFVVNVALNSNSQIKDSVLASSPVTGLLEANFLVVSSLGVTIDPDTVVETSVTPGEYTFTCTTDTVAAGDTVGLLAINTDEKLYKADTVTLT